MLQNTIFRVHASSQLSHSKFYKILLFKNFMAAKMESENAITPSLSIFTVIYSILSPDS